MDIDFHYHATFVAARFAGYSYDEAKVIGTAAQMIDENGVGIAGDALNVIDPDHDGKLLHVFSALPTFAAGFGENVPMAMRGPTQDRFASVWSVFHFLPGNFDVHRSVPDKFVSRLWTRREWGGSGTAPPLFQWVCRPHSPMAMHLIANCRDLVHDPRSVVSRQNLALYLIGVTMHVFIDTWAHQDFVGPPEKAVNDARGDTYFAYTPSQETRRDLIPSDNRDNMDWQKANWSLRKLLNSDYAPRGSDVSYTGHGRMGHWPDHSALIWKYTPAWAGAEIIRNNPRVYLDTFCHMVAALLAIRNNTPYVPFELNRTNIQKLCTDTAGSEVRLDEPKLRVINSLIQKPREALPHTNTWNDWNIGKIDDDWDAAVAVHSKEWQAAMPDELGVGDATGTWYPGKSAWVREFLSAVRDSGKQRKMSVHVFRSLDYFKFNYAAKLHYRAVKFQLKALNQQLIGEWNDGSAFVEDYEVLTSAARDEWREKIRLVLTDCAKRTKKQYRQEGLVVLLQDLDLAPSESAMANKLRLAISDPGEAVYTLRHRDGGNTVSQIEKLLNTIGHGNAGGRAVESYAEALESHGLMPSVAEFKEKLTYVRFARRASDEVLVKIDTWLARFHGTKSIVEKMLAARSIVAECSNWLKPEHSGEVSRKGGIEGLRRAARGWIADNQTYHDRIAREQLL